MSGALGCEKRSCFFPRAATVGVAPACGLAATQTVSQLGSPYNSVGCVHGIGVIVVEDSPELHCCLCAGSTQAVTDSNVRPLHHFLWLSILTRLEKCTASCCRFCACDVLNFGDREGRLSGLAFSRYLHYVLEHFWLCTELKYDQAVTVVVFHSHLHAEKI